MQNNEIYNKNLVLTGNTKPDNSKSLYFILTDFTGCHFIATEYHLMHY